MSGALVLVWLYMTNVSQGDATKAGPQGRGSCTQKNLFTADQQNAKRLSHTCWYFSLQQPLKTEANMIRHTFDNYVVHG